MTFFQRETTVQFEAFANALVQQLNTILVKWFYFLVLSLFLTSNWLNAQSLSIDLVALYLSLVKFTIYFTFRML